MCYCKCLPLNNSSFGRAKAGPTGAPLTALKLAIESSALLGIIRKELLRTLLLICKVLMPAKFPACFRSTGVGTRYGSSDPPPLIPAGGIRSYLLLLPPYACPIKEYPELHFVKKQPMHGLSTAHPRQADDRHATATFAASSASSASATANHLRCRRTSPPSKCSMHSSPPSPDNLLIGSTAKVLYSWGPEQSTHPTMSSNCSCWLPTTTLIP